MKKLIAYVFTLMFILLFSGCGNTTKELESIIINSTNMPLEDVEELFFEDDSHFYRFAQPISPYVVVKYTDGSTENVKNALESSHIQITDLDKYNIKYWSEPKHIENIIDMTQSGEIYTDDEVETFYVDDTYIYHFGSIQSHYVIVYYKDGSEQNVKDALAEGNIKITDLDWFDIEYYKKPIE